MNKLFTLISSGEFWGATIFSLSAMYCVFRFWAKSKINQWFQESLQNSQHELDIQKQSIQADLSVYVNRQNLRYSRFDEQRRVAIEKIYSQIVATRITNHGFTKFKELENITRDECYRRRFEYCKKTFLTFSSVFEQITKAFHTIDDNAIYLDKELEELASQSLTNIHLSYRKVYEEFLEVSEKTNNLYENKLQDLISQPPNFEHYYDRLVKDWSLAIEGVMQKLKSEIRDILSPK